MESTIREKVLLCSELFKNAPDNSHELRDVHQRFVEWYTNIAGHRIGPASLDERLRDAPDVRAAILRFLDTLKKVLEYRMLILLHTDGLISCRFLDCTEASTDRYACE